MEAPKTELEILTLARDLLRRRDIHGALASILENMLAHQKPPAGSWGFTAGMPQLDALCQKIGRFLCLGPVSMNRKADVPRDVYLASEIYPIGGHTALIGDYVGNCPQRAPFLLLGNPLNRDAAPQRARLRTGIPETNIEVCDLESLESKLHWMIGRIRELRPDRLFIFNHPEDPIPVAAAQRELTKWMYFVHHADHTPALGLYLPCDQHFDLTPRAAHCCGQLLDVGKVTYIPLQCTEPKSEFIARDSSSQPHLVTTASSGSSNKFSFSGPESYPNVVTSMLANTDSRHIHIGPLPRKLVNRWRSQLIRKNIDQDRLTLVPEVPSVWQAMIDFKIDLYINSFPTPGARACVEVMGSGTPILLHSSVEDQTHSTIFVSYPEAAQWNSKQEIVKRVRRATPVWLAAQRKYSRIHFERFHAGSLIVPRFLRDPIIGPELAFDPRLLEHYRSEVTAFRNTYNLPTRGGLFGAVGRVIQRLTRS